MDVIMDLLASFRRPFDGRQTQVVNVRMTASPASLYCTRNRLPRVVVYRPFLIT